MYIQAHTFLALLLAVALLASPCSAATYTVTEIGTFGGPGSCPTDISNSGQVVGCAETPEMWGPMHAARGFLWDHGVLTDLGTFGKAYNSAAAVNDSGTIAVYASDWWSQPPSTVLLQGGSATLLSGISAPLAVNNLGAVAGYIYVDQTHYRAAVWANNVVTDLGTFGGAYGLACDINDTGWAVGYAYDTSNRSHAFLWDGATVQDLGLGGAYGINNRGQVCGSGFVWQNGARTEIPSFTAYAINDLGQMVGTFYDTAGHGYYTALWDDGVITNLSALIRSTTPYVLENPTVDKYSINNAGQIALTGRVLGSSSGYHALVLTPVPEPSSLAALTLGLLGVGVGLTRRRQMA